MSSRSAIRFRQATWLVLSSALALLAAILVWRGLTSQGIPNSLAFEAGSFSAVLDIGVLVFREGLECILVLAAITAGMTGLQQSYQRPVTAGAAIGFAATLITWLIAVRILSDISQKVSALNLQAATGLLAIAVLLIVMNWFFHKMYWTGAQRPALNEQKENRNQNQNMNGRRDHAAHDGRSDRLHDV